MDLTLGADNILRLNIPVNDWGPETVQVVDNF